MESIEGRKNKWVPELWISLAAYLLTTTCVGLLRNALVFDSSLVIYIVIGTVFVVPLCYVLLGKLPETWASSIPALFLGVCSGAGMLVMSRNFDNPQFYLGFYILALSFFHQSEFITTALFNPHRLSLDSYILNHSTEYHIAAVASWVEYALEVWLVPSLKSYLLLARIGLVMVVCGESMRKLAMFTARSNFSHLVMFRKRADHELVTNGVYGLSRHPAYVGWFYWSIGTQLMLCNPLCTVAYSAASWAFFNDRIHDEEEALLHFFGQKYVDYQKCVGTGLPFIYGKVDSSKDK